MALKIFKRDAFFHFSDNFDYFDNGNISFPSLVFIFIYFPFTVGTTSLSFFLGVRQKVQLLLSF